MACVRVCVEILEIPYYCGGSGPENRCCRAWMEIVTFVDVGEQYHHRINQTSLLALLMVFNAILFKSRLQDFLPHSERKVVVCPFHTHTACVSAFHGFLITEDTHTPFTSDEPKYNSMARRKLLMRNGQPTPIPL